MQQSIRKSLAKAAKEKEAPKEDIAPKKSNAAKSSLIRMLASQIVPRSVGNATEKATEETTTRSAAAAFPAEKQNLKNTLADAPQTEPPATTTNQQGHPSKITTTKSCPLCGQNIPEANYSSHFQAELDGLAASDDDTTWDPPPVQAANHQSLKRPLIPNNPPEQLKVYVLGGAPSVAVPRDPKKLKPLPIAMKRSSKPVRAYNYYADGAGFITGDEIGLDGHENVGIGWEGVGASTL